MSGKRRRHSTPVLLAWFYAAVVVLVLGSCWLFLSNADQLWPQRQVEMTPEMAQWRTDIRAGDFAGGIWKDASFWRCVNLSVVTATATTMIAVMVGIPGAYALSRFKIPGRAIIDVLFASVIVLPASSVALCLLVVFQYGPLFELQKALGFRVAHSIFPGIILAQLILALAMGMSAWRAAFDRVNPRFEYVARSLGSSPWRAFRTVTLPAAKTGILAGIILAWTRAVAEFGAVLLFCGTFRELPLSRFDGLTRTLQLHQADILPVAMWTEIEYGNVEYGFGVGFSLVLISAISVYALHKLGGKGYVW